MERKLVGAISADFDVTGQLTDHIFSICPTLKKKQVCNKREH
jgi:hypothetical protein